MKLDKMQFAKLIGWLSWRTSVDFDEGDMLHIDNLCQINTVEVVPTDPKALTDLMRAINAGEKIAAIKAHRSLTGWGLKESKEAVDKDWIKKWTADELRTAFNRNNPPWNKEEHEAIKKFIDSLDSSY